jgi:hypothetical protein
LEQGNRSVVYGWSSHRDTEITEGRKKEVFGGESKRKWGAKKDSMGRIGYCSEFKESRDLRKFSEKSSLNEFITMTSLT